MIPARLAGSNPMVRLADAITLICTLSLGQIDLSNVSQKAYLEAAHRLPEHLKLGSTLRASISPCGSLARAS
jgi:hypothetical protein